MKRRARGQHAVEVEGARADGGPEPEQHPARPGTAQLAMELDVLASSEPLETELDLSSFVLQVDQQVVQLGHRNLEGTPASTQLLEAVRSCVERLTPVDCQ